MADLLTVRDLVLARLSYTASTRLVAAFVPDADSGRSTGGTVYYLRTDTFECVAWVDYEVGTASARFTFYDGSEYKGADAERFDWRYADDGSEMGGENGVLRAVERSLRRAVAAIEDEEARDYADHE